MAEQRMRLEWAQTAKLAALIAEPHRDRKKRSQPFTDATFNPFTKQTDQKIHVSFETAMGMFPGR